MGERNPGTAETIEHHEENQEKEKRTKMHTQDGRTLQRARRLGRITKWMN
jgi:hypothetical protein